MSQPRLPYEPRVSATSLAPEPPGSPGSPAVVAFYLPQYHRIPENDAWWGKGFTDWRNVMTAEPLYPGHAIPNVPGELGAYDLLSRDVRSAQAELAREHGVYAFCYYFYWFSGRRLLERPLELMLADGEPSLPFCLCWANEPWTRRWDGRESDVLMPQHHDRVHDVSILDDLMPYFEDERYIRIDGRPLLLIYRQSLLDEPARFAAQLREEAVRRGLPGLYLCNVLSIGDVDGMAKGFDAAVEFPPNGTLGKEIRPRDLGADPAFKGKIYDYASVVQTMLARPILPYPYFPGVMPRWDNTARKGMAAHIFHSSTPQLFERWLRQAASIAVRRNPQAPLVFVNSWNEWAEGAHLEPDVQAHHGYLQATRRGLTAEGTAEPACTSRLAATDPSHGRSDLLPGCVDRSVTVTYLKPGWPSGLRDDSPSDGVAWIYAVDAGSIDGHVLCAWPGQTIRIAGWFCRPGSRPEQAGGRAYVTFSSAETSWHAPLARRPLPEDVLRGMLDRGGSWRKLVRALDRLPQGIEHRALGAVTLGTGVGFEVDVELATMRPGRYAIGFAEPSRSGGVHVASAFRLHVHSATGHVHTDDH